MLCRACTTPSSGTHHNDQAAESNVEPLTGDVERLGVVDGEADASALLARQRRPRDGDVLGVRVEGVHARCAGGGERGQSSLAAADFEYPLALERDQLGDRRRLDSVLVAPLHSLRPRLVGLDGGAAGAELLRFAAGVFELGAGVGVDELAGLDPLEAVTF
jgi:hypothetical protein